MFVGVGGGYHGSICGDNRKSTGRDDDTDDVVDESRARARLLLLFLSSIPRRWLIDQPHSRHETRERHDRADPRPSFLPQNVHLRDTSPTSLSLFRTYTTLSNVSLPKNHLLSIIRICIAHKSEWPVYYSTRQGGPAPALAIFLSCPLFRL